MEEKEHKIEITGIDISITDGDEAKDEASPANIGKARTHTKPRKTSIGDKINFLTVILEAIIFVVSFPCYLIAFNGNHLTQATDFIIAGGVGVALFIWGAANLVWKQLRRSPRHSEGVDSAILWSSQQNWQ